MLSDNFSTAKDASLDIAQGVRSSALTHAARALTAALDAATGEITGTALNTVARPQSLADEAHRQLLLQLDIGLWKVGSKLPPEKALADSLGVSRPIVREALARLKADGRIESRQGSGAFVAERNKIAAFRLQSGVTASGSELGSLSPRRGGRRPSSGARGPAREPGPRRPSRRGREPSGASCRSASSRRPPRHP